MIKRVLLGFGGTPLINVALRYAMEIAKKHDAELTLASVENPDAFRTDQREEIGIL